MTAFPCHGLCNTKYFSFSNKLGTIVASLKMFFGPDKECWCILAFIACTSRQFNFHWGGDEHYIGCICPTNVPNVIVLGRECITGNASFLH